MYNVYINIRGRPQRTSTKGVSKADVCGQGGRGLQWPKICGRPFYIPKSAKVANLPPIFWQKVYIRECSAALAARNGLLKIWPLWNGCTYSKVDRRQKLLILK